MRAPFRAADTSNQPYYRIVARMTLANLPASGDDVLLEARAIVREAGLAGLLDDSRAFRGLLDRLRAPKRAAAPIEVSVLDGYASRDGARSELSPREWELLALLALRPPLTTEELAATLYPDKRDAAARNALKVLVRRVRLRLGQGAVTLVGNSYRLAESVEVDVSRCERAVRDGDREAKAAAYERIRDRRTGRLRAREWFAAEERRLTELEQRLACDLARGALERGETSAALGYARAIAAIDPYDEAACEMLMRALLNAGREGEAVREYRAYRDLMMRELGVAPSRALRSLLDGCNRAVTAG
jgi:DNA-binding SARP family transcriptional activator